MEDVIDVMEDLITKVTEMESRRCQSQSANPPPDNVTNVNPVKCKSGSTEIIVLDESLPKAFEYQNDMNVPVDPLSTDSENVVMKKEPVTEMVVCKEVIRTLAPEDKLDEIDLAMEVVEEIVVEEVIVDDELDQISSGEHKANECEEQITEFKTSQACSSIMDGEGVKIQPDASECPQLIGTKLETSGDNGNGEDGDDECEDDDDDEYDGDDDDDDEEEEEGKDVKKDELSGGNGVMSENKPPKLTEQQPATDDLGNIMPEVSINRRSSQESTTTTTTTTTTETSTANSSASSSDSEGDSSSSNEDSSNSSSNSDSDNASESNSEEAEQTTGTSARVASTTLTDKKSSQVPATAKGEGAKKRDIVGDHEQGPKYGMYVV
jgi:hypothetical protein